MSKQPQSLIAIGDALSQGWRLTLAHSGFLVLLFVAMAVVSMVSSALGNVLVSDAGFPPMLVRFVVRLINSLETVILLKAILDGARGKKLAIGKVFEGVTPSLFLHYVITQWVLGLITVVGLIFFIVPGIYFMLKYFFATYVVIDKRVGFAAAMKESARLTKGRKVDLLGFGVVLLIVNLLGLLCVGIGLLVTVPVTMFAVATVYNNLSSKK